MAVVLNPDQFLTFKRPLTRHTKEELTITNNSDEQVAFKVKTTTPKLYCVRPNAGRIEPHSSAVVQVMLQSVKEEPAPNVECKDKFLILTVPIDETTATMDDIHTLWNYVEANQKSKITQSKLRCVFASESATIPEEPAANGNALPKEPAPSATEPIASTTSLPAAKNDPVHTEQIKHQPDANEEILRLQQELNEYRQKLSAKENALKQEAPRTIVQQKPAVTGVPPAIVGLVALAAFILGYFILPSLS